jgi:hypothetical protein
LIQNSSQNASCTKRQKKAGADGQSRLQRALPHNQSEHVAPMCAQCHADSDLASAAGDRVSFDAIDTDHS